MDGGAVWLPADSVTSWAGEDEQLWRAATVTQETAGADGAQVCTCVTCDDGAPATRTLPREELLLRDVLPPAGVDDLVSLGNLHAPAILDNLRLRFARPDPGAQRQRSIYTYCGNICIAMNPYERLAHLYTQETKQSYIDQQSFSDSPPHIYAVAEAAYSNMMRSQSAENQSILVSGESGAGKTESVKIMMSYLADRNQRGGVDSESVAQAVIRSTPLLETFGNSKTKRNNNSSRFGKFTQVLFDSEGSIVGSRVDVYLLEKSRIVRQLVGERNYHVFYQLLSATTESLPGAKILDDGVPAITREELGLPEPAGVDQAAQFNFLADPGSESFVSEGIDDIEWFAEMVDTMCVIGVSTVEQQELLRVIAAVMQVGQITFESEMGASGDDRGVLVGGEGSASLCATSRLLSCTPADLQAVLETRQISARMETYTVNLNKSEAEAARDALGKALYDKLFAWLVGRINVSTAPKDSSAVAATIGVLDIFGFESFGTNSLEQLLINFANEKLQQQFTWYVFKLEQAEYEKEGIVWSSVDFKDNQPILDVLEGQGSILALLDEECRLQNGSDETFVEKLKQSGKRATVATADGVSVTEVLTFPKRTHEAKFILRHYAGYVDYSAENFREKNKDAVHPQLLELLQQTGNGFVSTLFTTASPAGSSDKGSPSRQRRGGSKMTTLGSSFKEQLTSLVSTINSTTVHYVRCIKPNPDKSTTKFDLAGVSSQLRCQGILEAIRISRAAYPNRLRHAQLLQRYALCMHDASVRKDDTKMERGALEHGWAGDDDLSGATKLLAALELDPSLPGGNYQVGKTKCFMKRSAMEKLEASRSRVLGWFCIRIQAETRCWLGKQSYARIRRSATLIQRVGRGMLARERVRQERAAIVLQSILRGNAAVQQRTRTIAGVLALQSLVRGAFARQAVVVLRRNVAVTYIQASYLRWAGARHFACKRQAATIIQREARGRIYLHRYLNMRDEAREEASMYGQLSKLKKQLHAEGERRVQAEAENERLRQHQPGQLSSGSSQDHAPSLSPAATSPSPSQQASTVSQSSQAAAAAASGLRTPVAGVAMAPLSSSATSSVSSPAGWLEGIGGILGSGSGPKPSSSYSEDEIEAIDRERMMLKRKLSTEARNMQRIVDEKDKKIKELQRRELRASRKSAQETGVLHEERKKNAQLQNDLRKEIELARDQKREMDIILENSQGLKGMIRGMLTENEKLKAQVDMLQESHVTAHYAPPMTPDADFGVYLHSSAIPELPLHSSTAGGGAAAAELDYTAEDALKAATKALTGRASRLASKWW